MKAEDIFFPFVPVAKGRPKFSKFGAYTPKKTREYEEAIKEYYKQSGMETYYGPVQIKLVFQMPIPKSFSKKKIEMVKQGFIKHTKRPDADNLGKAVLDALNGVAYEDDSNITVLTIVKRYSQFPGVTMTIREDDT